MPHVQCLRLGPVGPQRHWRRAHIGGQAQCVDDVQAPGLGRNVAGRIAQVQERFEVVAARLRHHLATAVMAKPVSHDPVCPDCEGGGAGHGWNVALELGQHGFVAAMHDQVEGNAGQHHVVEPRQ